MNKQMQEHRDKLLRLIQEHPDLPVVPMVEPDVVGDDSWGRWMGEWGNSYVTSIYMGNEHIHFKDYEDEEDVLSDMAGCQYYRTKDGMEITCLSDEEWNDLYASIPWTPCIVVNIDTL